jgi:hypothetical protein
MCDTWTFQLDWTKQHEAPQLQGWRGREWGYEQMRRLAALCRHAAAHVNSHNVVKVQKTHTEETAKYTNTLPLHL